MGCADLLTRLNELGGANGIGRVDLVENRFVGMKSRGVYETPGGTILRMAHQAVESITMDREVLHLRDGLIPRYASLIYNGFWFSPEMKLLQDTIDAAQAGQQAVRMLLSGPAGGLVGATWLGSLSGHDRLLTFDMGGTSTDVSLIDGEPQLTSEGRIGRWPVAVSMVDMHTIGAGGGSIAWIDAGGLLQVGPESAGAAPGPACYGKGGTRPAVTDANLVLGRLQADAFLGGAMTLDAASARRAVATVAEPLGLGIEVAARGIIDIANEHMAQALRVISVQRGIDPRDIRTVEDLHQGDLAEFLKDPLLSRRSAGYRTSPTAHFGSRPSR